MSVPTALFVCGRNAIRSPMGAALWDQRYGEGMARSCGVIPAAFVDPFMVSVMLEKGVDMEDFSPIALNGVGEPAAELVVSRWDAEVADGLASTTGAGAAGGPA